MDSTSFQLTKILSPFQRAKRAVSQRIYCAESLGYLCKEFDIDSDGFAVILNGVIVDCDSWETTVPAIGDEVLFVPLIQGGDDDKQILGVVAMIALTLVSGGIAAGAAGGLLSATGGYVGLTTLGISALQAAIVIGGSMAINSMLPSPDQDRRADFSGDYGASQNFAWNPHTTHQEGLVAPKAYGRNKLYGNIRSAYTTISNDEDSKPTGQTLSILFGLCQGPVKGIVANTHKLNDQLLLNFPDVSTEEKLGTDIQTVVSFMSGTKHEIPVNRRFTLAGGAISYTTPNKNFDQLEIEILFPKGLYRILLSGGLASTPVTVKVEISEAGAAIWDVLANGIIETNSTKPIRLLYNNLGTHEGGAPVTITRGTQYDIRITRTNGVDDDSSYGNDTYLGNVREVITDAFTYPMRALLALEALATDKLSGTLKFSCVHDGSIVPIYQNNNFAIVGISKAATAVITAAAGHGIVANDYVLFTGVNGMTEIRDKVGRVTGTTATTITTNIVSTNFSAYTSGGTGWEYDIDWSDDPGSVIFDILTDPVITGDGGGTPYEVDRFRGYSPSKINKVSLYAVTDHCADVLDNGRGGTENRCRFNGLFDTATDRWSAILKVCEAAQCIPVWNGVEIEFAIDKASSPVQKFNVANIDLDTFEESWLEQIGLGSEFEAHYIDEDMDYRREILPVYDPDITTNSSRISFNVMGLTSQSEVWRLGQLRLAKNRLLKTMISFTADIDAIDCTIGNNIYVQHDVPDQWGDGGRVISGTTAEIIVGKDLTYASGSTYKLLVRHADDTLSSKTVLNIYNAITGVSASTFVISGNYTSVYKTGDKITVADSTGNDGIYTLSIDSTFGGADTTITVAELVPSGTADGGLFINRKVVVTVAFGSAPESGDLWTFGVQDVEIYTVLNLSRDVDQKVKLSCIEYDSSVYDPDSDTPLITTDQGITAPESAPSFLQQSVNWAEVASRYPALATIGPPVMDVPIYTGIIFSDDIVNLRVNWSAGTITYKGAGYSVTAGNSGTAKYIYWDVNDSPTTFNASNTQSDGVGEGKFIRCINDSGVAHIIGNGKLYWGEMLIVETLSALSAQLGDVLAGSITGSSIVGGTIQTATSGQRVMINSDGIQLLSAAPASGVIGTAGSGGSDIVIGASSTKTITAITQAANAKISATAHGFTTGNKVFITGVVGMTEINYDTAGLATITDDDPDVDSNAFEVDINSTAFTPYDSAGTAQVGSGEIPGSGVLVTINHPDKNVPIRIESEQTYADFHYFNRAATPSGAAEVADKCVVSGIDYTCTVAGTPGTWTKTGTQT